MAHWRVGQHYRIHVYETGEGDGHDGTDRPVATFHTAADARLAVEAVNRMLDEPPTPAVSLVEVAADLAERWHVLHNASDAVDDGLNERRQGQMWMAVQAIALLLGTGTTEVGGMLLRGDL